MDDPSSPRREPLRQVPPRERIFNIPAGVLALAVLLLGIHALRSLVLSVLSPATDDWVVRAFSFIPARELASAADLAGVPGGALARVWSPLTYAFLHADWSHVGLNVIAMVAFGSPLGWRFGSTRFLVFSALGALAGAALHFAFYSQDVSPLVGASAAISAQMAGVARFAFTRAGMFGAARGRAAYRTPALSLVQTFTDRRVVVFIVAWFATNLVFGLFGFGSISSGPVAWDAHVGGFVAGLLLFSLFDPA